LHLSIKARWNNQEVGVFKIQFGCEAYEGEQIGLLFCSGFDSDFGFIFSIYGSSNLRLLIELLLHEI